MTNIQPEPDSVGSDAAALFSRYGDANMAKYQDVLRQGAALAAAARWPLLVEIHDLEAVLQARRGAGADA